MASFGKHPAWSVSLHGSEVSGSSLFLLFNCCWFFFPQLMTLIKSFKPGTYSPVVELEIQQRVDQVNVVFVQHFSLDFIYVP